jgi:F0F1-type ATP synthase membrane subunit c/vacuolar-type H+-ATPase subunit K
MEILASLIRWIKTGNIAVITLTMMAIVTVAMWMTLFGGSGKADAQEASDSRVAEYEEVGTEEEVAEEGKAPQSAWGLGLLAAAISTSISAIAAGVAVSIVGSAAMAAVAERPEVMGRSIIFVGLAEGIAIYGLIISIMILSKL